MLIVVGRVGELGLAIFDCFGFCVVRFLLSFFFFFAEFERERVDAAVCCWLMGWRLRLRRRLGAGIEDLLRKQPRG